MGDKDARARRRLTRRDVVAASAAALAIPAILRHTRAYAQEPVMGIGYVSALTGVHARTAVADPHVLAGIRAILANGLENNGRRRPRWRFYHKDSQRHPCRRWLAAELVLRREGRSELPRHRHRMRPTRSPTSPKVNGVPCITTDSPWQPFFFGRGGNPEIGFDWTYHFYWGVEDHRSVHRLVERSRHRHGRGRRLQRWSGYQRLDESKEWFPGCAGEGRLRLGPIANIRIAVRLQIALRRPTAARRFLPTSDRRRQGGGLSDPDG